VNFQILRHFQSGTRAFLVFGGISPLFVLHLIGLIVRLGPVPRAWLSMQGRLKVRHKAAGAAMLVPVLLGLLLSLGPVLCQC
jgi:hypothetical protein